MGKVEIKNLLKEFNGTVANDNINLTIEDGEFFILLGPSGCGKTTLLRSIAGLEEPDSGEIYIDGKSVIGLAPKDRNVGLVFQNLALFSHMSGFDNIAFPLRVKDLEEDKIKEKVESVAERVKARDLLNKDPGQMSGGEKQRVALGRTVARDPEVFLMDEPLANLDASLKIYMHSELQKLHQELDRTIIYVTHDQNEAMKMADRIALMKDGELQQVGSPDELYNSPNNLFVGEFIGTPPMSMIEGKIGSEENGYYFESKELRLELSDSLAERLMDKSSSENVVMGLRSEDFDIADSEGANVLKGKISVVEPEGSDVYIDVVVGSNEITARIPPSVEVEVGDEILLKIDEENLYFFDKESEDLISARVGN